MKRNDYKLQSSCKKETSENLYKNYLLHFHSETLLLGIINTSKHVNR